MSFALRILLVYGAFFIGVLGPALFDNKALATAWMTVWAIVTFAVAVRSKRWNW